MWKKSIIISTCFDLVIIPKFVIMCMFTFSPKAANCSCNDSIHARYHSMSILFIERMLIFCIEFVGVFGGDIYPISSSCILISLELILFPVKSIALLCLIGVDISMVSVLGLNVVAQVVFWLLNIDCPL